MKSAIGAAVVALGVGVGIGWVAFGGGGDESGGGVAPPANGPTIEEVQQELATVKSALETATLDARNTARVTDKAQRRVTELEAEAEAAGELYTAPSGKTPTAAELEAALPENAWKKEFADGPLFKFTDMDKALGEIDWVEIGTDMSAMSGLIEHVIDSALKGTPPRVEANGEIQQHNGRLVTVFMKLSRAGISGSKMNGAITHPGVMSNAIASALAAAGKPLSEEQAKALAALGERSGSDEKKRVAAYDERTQALRKRVDESKLKQAFFKAAFEILSKEQADTLSPALTRGRISVDLFCEGLLWGAGFKPLPIKDTADLVKQVTEIATSQLGLSESEAEVTAIVDDWAAALPSEVTGLKLDKLALPPFNKPKSADVQRSADHTATLFERLLNELDLTEELRKRLLSAQGALVIYHTVDVE